MRKSSISKTLSSAKKMTKSISSWWSRESGSNASESWVRGIFDRKESFFDTDKKESRFDVFALAQYRRAVSNFVHIMTGNRNIPVVFNSNGMNCTDGKTIYLSASIKEKDFDSNVGLALHESSHILYTDTDYVKKELWDKLRLVLSGLKRSNGESLFHTDDIINGVALSKYGLDNQYIHTILNIVEDLYIDAMTYASAPGYREYYRALYIKFFDDPKIVKGFYDSKFAEVNSENYLFHLINIRNPKRNLNALPSLTEIFNELDLANIRRLSTQQDRIDLSLKVFSLIVENLKPLDFKIQDNSSENESGNASENASDSSESENESESESENASRSGGNSKEMSDGQINSLKKILEKQKDFINGNLKKSKVDNYTAEQISTASEIEFKEKVVLKGNGNNGVKTLVIRNITENFCNSTLGRLFSLYHTNMNTYNNIGQYIALGKLLAKRLQIRNEVRTKTTSRLKSGKIDKRLLHETGFENYEIFKKVNVNTFKDSYIHISIDQSGSMSGMRLDESVKFATMFATASKIIKNLHVVVSIRSTTYSSGSSKIFSNKPYLVYVFDSKVNNINHIKNIFPKITSANYTPEGITFEAIQEEIKKDSLGKDSYFINLCDGEPGCDGYGGNLGREHSRKQLEKMEQNGINTSVYFFGSEYGFQSLRKTYPKNSHLLENAGDLNKIVQKMNKDLLKTALAG